MKNRCERGFREDLDDASGEVVPGLSENLPAGSMETNLCRADDGKACAACCGLYNVPDGTRDALGEKLEYRTRLFRNIDRSIREIDRFQAHIREVERILPLDDAIHVCEFTGFVDEMGGSPGCLLHPTAAGNSGVDLRGLCHYGSLACKSFYCPAWHDLEPSYRSIAISAIDDRLLYGLVVTDLNFLNSLFSLIELATGRYLEPGKLFPSAAGRTVKEMLSWKDSWPFKADSRIRRTPFYVSADPSFFHARDPESAMQGLMDSLKFTFGLEDHDTQAARIHVTRTLRRFASEYLR